ncbi:HEAT repeat domain-containing protein [Methanoregula sp.]|uniref:HEAT repeat domain-containing protein n=1 Tax=Methanoregula sp. TaxID=2052170 RepID=UPI002BED32A4|nr:HEAT repeat domain-containing protein [Methanoregula sp.]HVP96945.1 HEAT repeat domain-containing protein [Methanoregula sp.]
MNFPRIFAVNAGDIPPMKERRDIRGLVRALKSPDFAVQTEAAKALGTIGAEAMDDLLCALSKGNKDVKLGVIGALAVIRDPRSVGPLIAGLHDPESEVRWQAAFALGEIGDSRATGPLVTALRDPDKYVRYGAAYSLAKLEWNPETPEERAFYFAGMQEWKALADTGPAAVPALTVALSDRDPGVRRKAVGVLGEIGTSEAVPSLMQGLADADSEVRWHAVLSAPRCGIDPLFIPRGISRRPRTAKNPLVAAFLNFLLPGLGYGYIGKWWGIMIFQIDVTATVWLFKYEGQADTYGLLFPLYILLAIHAWYLAAEMPDFS